MNKQQGKHVVMINTGPFPEGDAGAVRLLYTAKALRMAGYTVEVLCRGKKRDAGCVDGIAYRSFRLADKKRLWRGLDYYCFPARVRAYLQKHKRQIDFLYLYDAQPSVFRFCKSFARKHGAKLLYDCVEWYSPEQFRKGEKNKTYQMKNHINTELVDTSFSVIAISRFLEQYYTEKGIHALRLPVLCDAQEATVKAPSEQKLTLFYAGAPGRKDLIANIVRAVQLLTPEQRASLSVELVGVDRDRFVQAYGLEEKAPDACREVLNCHGRVPRSRVLEWMQKADFTVLPRNASLRYAKAGFPSKVTESLAHATPILCNYSSDLDLYLQDGVNAVIAEDHTPKSLAKALERALALTPSEKDAMKKAAFDCAKNQLDYRLFAESLHRFFENV